MARIPLVLFAAAASACAMRAATPPRPETFTLASLKATYRPYRGAEVGICEAEWRWLGEELTSVNKMLARYLGETTGTVDDAWPKARIELIEEATQKLPALLDGHAANLEDLQRCGFADKGTLPQIAERGRYLVSASRERLKESVRIVDYVAAAAARKSWIDNRPLEQTRVREQTCAEKSKGVVLYYAWKDDEANTQYAFCDGAAIVTDENGQSEFRAPPGLNKWQLKKLKQGPYLEAVFGFPVEQIAAAPALPEKPAASNSITASPLDG